MQKLLLLLHLLAAVWVWGTALRAFLLANNMQVQADRLMRVKKQSIVGLCAVASSGLLLSIVAGNAGLMTVCVRLGLYSVPVLISLLMVRRRLVDMKQLHER